MTRKTRYRPLSKKEEEAAIIQMMEVILDRSVPYSGKHRKGQWERGWGENLESGDITPKYFGKHRVNRLNGRLVYALDAHYEQDMLHALVQRLARKYMRKAADIYEFGCGTGHNLWKVREVNNYAYLHGFDWTRSSQKIVESMGFDAENFDFFNPSKTKLMPDSAVYTVAALEQTGENYEKFVAYLLKNKPSVVVHIEPIPELLDSAKLLDYLSIQYMHKRKYLRGYLTYLESLEKQGKLEILEAKRSGIGSFLIDGYSIIVWKPSRS